MITDTDLKHLRRCVDLARVAFEAGDEPFGSILVSEDGKVLFEDHNHVSGGDRTQHPEFAIARWAAQNMKPQERTTATVYTSGEHCSMCASAHGWAGLGRIVYASSSEQLGQWKQALGAPPSPVKPLRITDVLVDATVDGPVEQFADEIRSLHERAAQRSKAR